MDLIPNSGYVSATHGKTGIVTEFQKNKLVSKLVKVILCCLYSKGGKCKESEVILPGDRRFSLLFEDQVSSNLKELVEKKMTRFVPKSKHFVSCEVYPLENATTKRNLWIPPPFGSFWTCCPPPPPTKKTTSVVQVGWEQGRHRCDTHTRRDLLIAHHLEQSMTSSGLFDLRDKIFVRFTRRALMKFSSEAEVVLSNSINLNLQLAHCFHFTGQLFQKRQKQTLDIADHQILESRLSPWSISERSHLNLRYQMWSRECKNSSQCVIGKSAPERNAGGEPQNTRHKKLQTKDKMSEKQLCTSIPGMSWTQQLKWISFLLYRGLS